jgi:hypothetical protein
MAPLIPQRNKLPMLFNPVKEYEKLEWSLPINLAEKRTLRKIKSKSHNLYTPLL